MKYVVLDLEMNRVSKERMPECDNCKMEVIEIGAVVLDEHFQEIGSFKTLVKPQFNEIIEKRYTKLTGITTEMVAGAPFFEGALLQFLSWCSLLDDEISIYQWSETDLEQITKEMTFKGIEPDEKYAAFLTGWKDFQKEFGETLHLDRALSLKDAVMYAGIEFIGRAHDALHDARTTAELLKIVRTPELYELALKNVTDALTPKEISTSLGDLFDFAAFGIGA